MRPRNLRPYRYGQYSVGLRRRSRQDLLECGRGALTPHWITRNNASNTRGEGTPPTGNPNRYVN